MKVILAFSVFSTFIAAMLYLIIWGKRAYLLVQEWQLGLMYENGKFKKRLPPGRHGYFPKFQNIYAYDKRETTTVISGQDLLSQDNVPIKASVVAAWRIVDALKVVQTTQGYASSLYTAVQLALREAVITRSLDDLLSGREGIGEIIKAKVSAQASEWGLELMRVDLRDLTLSCDIKRVYTEVIKARKEAEAALERARGEAAAMRSLANTAKMMENNPALTTLRALQMGATYPNTSLVIHLPNQDANAEK